MQANVGRATQPEKTLRSALHRTGLRFRKDARVLPGLRCKADVVFRRARVAIFVDGCFWHGCPVHFKLPATNPAWWQEKVCDNARRDADQTRQVIAAGWVVFRYWEHEIDEVTAARIARQLQRAIRRRLSRSA